MIHFRNESAASVDEADLRGLAEFLMSAFGMAEDAELSIVLVDEDEIARLNRTWLGEPGPTDVLSFPMDELREPLPGQPPVSGVLGDIALCPSVAERQARERGADVQSELRVLLVHGALHLVGHDHADQLGADVMFARQAGLLAQYEREQTGGAPGAGEDG